jgi:hypothetical protein
MVRSLFQRLVIAVSCVLLLTMLLPLTIFAKSHAAEKSFLRLLAHQDNCTKTSV